MTQLPVLILGGLGKTGARVEAQLRARGIPTRVASRSTIPAFDWDQPQTWAAALQGASKAYVSFQPDLAVPGAAAAMALLGQLAQDAGLEQVVLLSGRGEPGAQAAEQALQASGAPCTIVRASWFAQNFSEGYLVEGVMAGEIALPAGDVPEPFVDADDIAEVAVAALTDPRHLGQAYEVTGPRALTFTQAAAEIAEATGRPLAYRQIGADAFAEGLRPYAPEQVVQLLLELFTVVLDGRNVATADGVPRALGRPARDFGDYARAAAAAGAWG
ncbi:MAG: NmrA family NAD(P)-binding protein [Caulobacterales bacterium]|nr:NmrA family NAD(P)-binding protein [Caulobacterales bacterium]